MEQENKEVGRFALSVILFSENGKLTPKFTGANFNMPEEILIAQLSTFVDILKDNYRQDFKGNITTISGKPE